MRARGPARAEADPQHAGKIVVRGSLFGTGELCVEVEDNGVGVGPDVRARIFDPFFTTKEAGKGTGLGLSIVRRIAGEHGGHVTLPPPRDGAGATFRVTLPIGVQKGQGDDDLGTGD